jgi:cytochrome c2
MVTRIVVALAAALSLACSDRGESPRHVVAGGDADRGRTLIRAHGCGGCHVVPGVRGARGTVGPPLTDFARRGYIAGALVNQPDNLTAWIMNAQAIEPGTVMPDLNVTAADARDIAAYLYTLGDDDGIRPPHIIPVSALDAVRGN